NSQIRSRLTVEQFKQEIRITKEITLEQMTEGLVDQLSDFAPFGIGNEEPIFLVHDKPTQIRQIGQQQNHLKLQFKTDHQIVDAIGFQFGKVAPLLAVKQIISFLVPYKIKEW